MADVVASEPLGPQPLLAAGFGNGSPGIDTTGAHAAGSGLDLADLAGPLDALAGRLVAPVARQVAARSRPNGAEALAGMERLFQTLAAEVLSPLLCDGRFLGVLALGRKRSRTLYGLDELDAIGDASRQIAVLVRRAILEDEIESLQDSVVRQAEIIEDQGQQISSLERRLAAGGEARRASSGARAREHACPPVELIGKDPAFQKIMSAVKEIAPTRSVVLILGATGTGKDLVARALHLASPRRDDPFVVVNCTAIPI